MKFIIVLVLQLVTLGDCLSPTGEVCIFDGPGVDQIGIAQFQSGLEFYTRTLKKTFLPSRIINIQDLEKDEIKSCKVLAFLGGEGKEYVVPYMKREVRENIQKFVKEGGVYFGTCAGAYFAGTKLMFGLGNTWEIMGSVFRLVESYQLGPLAGRADILDGFFSKLHLSKSFQSLAKTPTDYNFLKGGPLFLNPEATKIVGEIPTCGDSIGTVNTTDLASRGTIKVLAEFDVSQAYIEKSLYNKTFPIPSLSECPAKDVAAFQERITPIKMQKIKDMVLTGETGKPAAIVESDFGKGIVLLTSTHPDYREIPQYKNKNVQSIKQACDNTNVKYTDWNDFGKSTFVSLLDLIYQYSTRI